MELPKIGTFGKYVLEDGSIIYPSGQPFLDAHGNLIATPNPGKWMLWVRSGTGENNVPIGDFVLDPMYFDTPELALSYHLPVEDVIPSIEESSQQES